jgi:hypothetical protein
MPSLYTSAQFADYATAAAATRKVLGLSRLSPAQAAMVRDAVARHEARRAAKSVRASITSTDRLRNKLAQRDAARLGNALGRNYRGYDLSDVRVSFGSRLEMPGISSRTSTKWVSGRRGYGHVTDGQTISATIQTGWGRKVYDAGLSELDGLVTLSAELRRTEGEISIYRAYWVRQGRGYDLVAEGGYIATMVDSDGRRHSYHSTVSEAGALVGLRRKRKPLAEREAVATKTAETRQANRERKIAALISRISRWDFAGIEHVVVTRHDSIQAGNCVPGTDAFIDRFAPGRDQATLGELAGLLRSSTLSDLSNTDPTLARKLAASCLVAICRDKAASRALVMA